MQRSRCFVVLAYLLFAAMFARTGNAQELANLPPIAPEDLALKDNPAAPGSAAMILYYAVDTDNVNSTETHSARIKVFRDEGRKYATVEIPYYEKDTKVEEIRARTFGSDGKITEFTDQVYDREILKGKKIRVLAKVLTLPNVEVGSIVEYSYRLHFKEKVPDVFRHPETYRITGGYTYPAAEWELQRELAVRHGHFTLRAVKGAPVEVFYVGKPKDAGLERSSDGRLQLDLENVPAYEEEEYSPPEANLKLRANLYYEVGFFSADEYWKELARKRGETVERFIGNSKAIQKEAEKLVKAGDSSEANLRRIYERVQQIRAVNYEPQKSEKEMKQENLKENKDAEDVLNHGYAYTNEIDLLFVALARAAGFQAYPLMVSSRQRAFFMKEYPNERQLNAMVVLVQIKVDDVLRDSVFLDPATRFCPYGLLPWEETATGGILEDSLRGSVGATPVSSSKDAVVRREAKLQLNGEGGLSGKVTVSYFGQTALSMRLEAIRQDEVGRQKELEEPLKNSLAQGATVKLLKSEGWESPEGPLKAELEIEVPNFAIPAGKRLILPLGVFHSNAKNPFSSSRRTHPIYFGYAQETYEDVKVDLPPGLQVDSLPENKKEDRGGVYYELTSKLDGTALHTARVLRIGTHLIKKDEYGSLRGFYDKVVEGDAQQVILRNAESASPK